jgi:hypothetical protein
MHLEEKALAELRNTLGYHGHLFGERSCGACTCTASQNRAVS